MVTGSYNDILRIIIISYVNHIMRLRYKQLINILYKKLNLLPELKPYLCQCRRQKHEFTLSPPYSQL